MNPLRPFAFAVAFFALAASGAGADQTFATPHANGAAVDNCAIWGDKCGWGGAHQFCQTKGFEAALSWQLTDPGVRTYVIGSERFCEGANCVGFSRISCRGDGTLPRTAGRDITFDKPMVSGAAVDACASWATDCGAGGARAFCQTQGYAAASSWEVYKPRRTFVIGSNRVCEGDHCTGLSRVVCVAGPHPGYAAHPDHPPLVNSILAGRWKGERECVFAESGSNFTWRCAASAETGQGTMDGENLTARRSRGNGAVSITGRIVQRDPYGRASLIRWSDGREWFRID
jgi:hypothetical protein